MKFATTLVLFVTLFYFATVTVTAEDSTDAAQAVERFVCSCSRLSRNKRPEAVAKLLDEDGNRKHRASPAGIGSTRPEELRELRRRQLTIERDSVRDQLKLLAASKERLESVIRTGEARGLPGERYGVLAA